MRRVGKMCKDEPEPTVKFSMLKVASSLVRRPDAGFRCATDLYMLGRRGSKGLSGPPATLLHDFCRAERSSITLSHSFSARFAVLQGRRATLLKQQGFRTFTLQDSETSTRLWLLPGSLRRFPQRIAEKKCWKFFPNRGCVRFYDFGLRERQTCREPWVDTVLHLGPTFCARCFLK